ncbi:MAG: bacteriohopanetetrol glucosamine biosynthesis glycosyltransferase HpnI [Terriglobales bacterium]|jgi:ceramide glucosyltransferase
MLHFIPHIIEIIAVFGTLSSIGYYLICLWSAAGFLGVRKAADRPALSEVEGSVRPTPPVSILKPLKGTDPGMYESLRSHCLQDYPDHEIIFGVSDADDAAVEIVERLKAEFPQLAIKLVVCVNDLGTNTKVSNLAQMKMQSRYEYLLVNDSDIRVAPDYLRRVVVPLLNPKIGLVTCLYRGVASPTLGSQLESLGISTDFCAGVLTARSLEKGIRFGLGSTLAFRAADLQAIGGFEALVDYLSDDYEIGKRISALGREIKLSEVVVETFLPAYTLRGFLDHQLRWARCIRDSRRWGYTGLLLTFGLPWAVLTLIAAKGAAWAWFLLGITAGVRLAMSLVIGRDVLQDRQVARWLWLVPLRDFAALFVWIASFAGHTVTWRGDRFTLKDGRLSRVAS